MIMYLELGITDGFSVNLVQNVDRAVLKTVFKNTFRRVNKCLETGRGHFERYL
jgi:hypothetical protein